MTFFTIQEFKTKYNLDVEVYQIEMASEMIYSQVGLRYRDPSWSSDNVPTPINDRIVEIVKKCQAGELKPEPANIKLFNDLLK